MPCARLQYYRIYMRYNRMSHYYSWLLDMCCTDSRRSNIDDRNRYAVLEFIKCIFCIAQFRMFYTVTMFNAVVNYLR